MIVCLVLTITGEKRLLFLDDTLVTLFFIEGNGGTCMLCTELLTVKHILLFCSDFVETKDQYFRAQSLKVLFKEISLDYYTIQYLYFSIYLSIIYISM